MTSKSTYQPNSPDRIGVLLINLGTPDAPTAQALRPYLKEFLSNPRVIEIPKLIWLPILYAFILPFRPKKSAEKYAKIWMPEGSPLKVYTERQIKSLREELQIRLQDGLVIEYAMNIGKPSVAAVMARMQEQGCERIVIIPLFPQYAASSTGAAMDSVFAVLKHMRNQPSIRTVKQYHDHSAYIAALAQSVHDYWNIHGRSNKLIMSFHGTPRVSLDKGDPYYFGCQKTGHLLAEALALDINQYAICFQSRFGNAKWLTPYTATTLRELGKQQMQRVDVICPGFVSDCLETLEEIAMEVRNIFINAGGKEFHYIPCLNDRKDWIHTLADITCTHLQGWLCAPVEEDRSQKLSLGIDTIK